MDLIKLAWDAAEKAKPIRTNTKVGCVIKTTSGNIYKGWNIEGPWATSIHAEVNAIGRIDSEIKEIVIVSDCKKFTPCGACMDWIIAKATKDAKIIVANRNQINYYKIEDLMPHYPSK